MKRIKGHKRRQKTTPPPPELNFWLRSCHCGGQFQSHSCAADNKHQVDSTNSGHNEPTATQTVRPHTRLHYVAIRRHAACHEQNGRNPRAATGQFHTDYRDSSPYGLQTEYSSASTSRCLSFISQLR